VFAMGMGFAGSTSPDRGVGIKVTGRNVCPCNCLRTLAFRPDVQVEDWVILSLNRWVVYKAMVSGGTVQSAMNKREIERAELDALLASGFLGRSNNLVRLLSFVCEKYFDGAFDEVKEYSIAVHALGRPEGFDPQVDTIVRVTAHALRKRLEDYYRSSGAHHAIHICLPPGHYLPKFINKANSETGNHALPAEGAGFETGNDALLPKNGFSPALTSSAQRSAPADRAVHAAGSGAGRRSGFRLQFSMVAVAVVVAVGALAGFLWDRSSRTSVHQDPGAAQAGAFPTSSSGQALRVTVGEGRALYVDRAGVSWETDRFCSGGSSFSVTGHIIQGTEDPQLFSAGRRGAFHCKYPLPPGTYEVHLLFAETSGLLENSRHISFSINDGPITNLDVVDDAGGDDIATIKVFTEVKPESDGTVHLDFNAPDSFLNAVEILPAASSRMLPVRIVAGPSLYRDSNGNPWMPDRYFFGGRVNRFSRDLSKISDGRLFEWHRYGHFHYVVPVVPGSKYTLKLYFLEHWFGAENGSVGGVGSRVFDVWCDGHMLLKGFDIFSEAGSGPLVKTFSHIEPTSQGKIEIYFTPGTNYPSVSAIEVLSE
jgi:hypothetical protein